MILITGASGYIGSHFLVEVINQNMDYLAVDDFSRSDPDTIKKINQITKKKVNFIQGNIGKKRFLQKIFSENNITKVIHFAGLKSINESYEYPLDYYQCNVSNTIQLLNVMRKYNTKKFIFSSSATVYGSNHLSPLKENLVLTMPESPYARSKFIIEQILKNIADNKNLDVGILRYFNPIGCHKSGIIGENINSKNSNLMPAIIRVILKDKNFLEIYGDNYKTKDGTGIRDYIHINDLINGHMKALNFIETNEGFNLWNLGSGHGYSVFDLLKAFEKHLNILIPYAFEPRREGDIAEYWADISKAKKELSWQVNENLEAIIKDTIKYIKKNYNVKNII